MTEGLHAVANTIAKALELAGVIVIAGGAVLALAAFVLALLRGTSWRSAYEPLRSDLGRGILLGLEFLVGADIIATITAPLTVESVGLLAGVVAIRTFLSFSLETEIEGCWPWRRADKLRADADNHASG